MYDTIDWEQKMIAISGARGVGKTTLMLQKQKELGGIATTSLYITLEHPYFYGHTLFELADTWYKMGGKLLFIDEVHKYINWSKELKVIYDLFPDLHIILSASSALEIYRGEADLSRRLINYKLPGLSFREYLQIKGINTLPKIPLHTLIKEHVSISKGITGFAILHEFQQYLKNGYYPFMVNLKESDYTTRLNQVINTVMDIDLANAEGYTPATAFKLKKLLAVLAESVPFQPNVAELARKLLLSRDTIYQYLNYLERASMLLALHAQGKGMSPMQKPEKLYLENTNLSYALKRNPDKGNLRETFLYNQIVHSGLEVSAPKTGDFYTEGKIIEVGGKTKRKKQLSSLSDAIIASDDIIMGAGHKVPLWMFGLLY